MNELIVVEKIAQWQRLKALVLDSSSPITKQVYSMALDEFLTWFRQESRPGGFCKATSVPGEHRSKSDVSARLRLSSACRRFANWRRKPPITACWRPASRA